MERALDMSGLSEDNQQLFSLAVNGNQNVFPVHKPHVRIKWSTRICENAALIVKPYPKLDYLIGL